MPAWICTYLRVYMMKKRLSSFPRKRRSLVARDGGRAHTWIPIVQFNSCYNIGYIQSAMRTDERVRMKEMGRTCEKGGAVRRQTSWHQRRDTRLGWATNTQNGSSLPLSGVRASRVSLKYNFHKAKNMTFLQTENSVQNVFQFFSFIRC